MPKIGGRLTNFQDPKGIIADASKIEYKDGLTMLEKVEKIDENMEAIPTPDELANFASREDIDKSNVRRYANIDMANADLASLPYGTPIVAKTDATNQYSQDYKLFIVAQNTNKEKVLKAIEGGGASQVAGDLKFTVEKIMINNVDVEKANVYECNIGDVITFAYTFSSQNYPDVRGKFYGKVDGETRTVRQEYPDGELMSWTFDTTGLSPKTYLFALYGVESTGRNSERTNIKFQIGGLNIQSTFKDTDVQNSESDLKIPVTILAADTEATISMTVRNNDEVIIDNEHVNAGEYTINIAKEKLVKGINNISIQLTNSKGKLSNILNYSVVVAEAGVVYLIPDKYEYEYSEGVKSEIKFRAVQLGKEKSQFEVRLTIKDSKGETVKLNGEEVISYTVPYGVNIVSLVGLPYKLVDGSITSGDATVRYSQYNINMEVNAEDEPGNIVSEEIIIKITENDYSKIKPSTDGLALWLSSEGRSNTEKGRDTWYDKSENNVGVSFHNFNWVTNGWLADDAGNTALKLNSGAYVEIDLAPFQLSRNANGELIDEELQELTISIDFATRDVLDASAKVMSSLYEYDGTETETYYLRDGLGEYIKRSDENITNYFKFAGGYCFIDGVDYEPDPTVEYEVTYIVSERATNFNLGEPNPNYTPKDGVADAVNPDYRKFLGTKTSNVTKQIGAYIDTEYAVLSNTSSRSSAEDKFHLNFSENTRTRIDLIITRKKDENGKSAAPYYFDSMIGYTNGMLSLMQAITDDDSFIQRPTQDYKFKLYLGAKGYIDEKDNRTVSDTGSCEIYSIRVYKKALDPLTVLRNYAAEIPNAEEKKAVIDNNGLINANTLAKLPRVCLIGAEKAGKNTINSFIMQLANTDAGNVSDLKKMKEPAYFTYTDPSGESWNDGQPIPIRLQFQGTSSMVYPVKNYKWKMYESFEIDETGEVEYGNKFKVDLGNGIRANCLCAKADFMDSSHTNNTGSANFISDYNEITGDTPASALDDRVRTTIYGYPILMYFKSNKDDGQDKEKFIGVYNLNLDKSETDSYGFATELEDKNGNVYNFNEPYYIDDEFSQDILRKTDRVIDFDGESLVEMENPEGTVVAYCTLDGRLRTLNNDKIEGMQCFEFKANSGAGGAGGFGNYTIKSISADLEARFPDDGDFEEEFYDVYVEKVGKDNAVSYADFRAPLYYHMQRMIKWVVNSDKQDFLSNVDKHFNRNYLMDYYLTIMTLGGVDSLGKNLMIASWGPENRLYIAAENDPKAFNYMDGETSLRLTPNRTILTEDGRYILASDVDPDNPETNVSGGNYSLAFNSAGLPLYYKESVFNRYSNSFTDKREINLFTADDVTVVPGEFIYYPIFYDIDTICGLDNSGQLLYDVDIELADKLSDGTSIFNTYDSNLWGRVNSFMGEMDASGNSLLSDRWGILRTAKFRPENMIQKFYYNNQIAKIPATYYNQDCMLKYVYEGPYSPGEELPEKDENGNPVIATPGSGSYLYCIHGSRYEQLKRWYSQRLYYLDTLFRKIGADNASLRFNHAYYDDNYGDTMLYYGDPETNYDFRQLVAKYPNLYQLGEDGSLLTAKKQKIEPIKFTFKTYQPGYVGVKWFNGGQIHMKRIRRGATSDNIIAGNVKTAGDAEVFIFGGSNIKEIGDMSPYNTKQVDFRNLKKLNKLILGSPDTLTVINKLDLGDNTYLSEINLENCSSLTTVNVKGCTNLKKINMTGSGITSVTLPEGGALESIIYPDSITNITLNNFINLTDVSTGSLNNLTTLKVTNCPKILGAKGAPNAKVWTILQLTEKAALSTINVKSYGAVEPTASGFFFPNKYCDYGESARNIEGEIYYKGSTIPANYTKFEEKFPKLRITYDNITDASCMFENYKNLNCIGIINAYAGEDDYGVKRYIKVNYWIDTRKEDFTGYEESSVYDTKKGNAQFYTENGKTYRLIGVYDKQDLDLVRAEIKKHVSNFTKFTNINAMFRGMEILDYLDPDTFNNVDISTATTDDMFYGCKNLKYFETPNDIVKNTLTKVFYNDEGIEITEEEYNELDSPDKYIDEFYVNPFTMERVEGETSVYIKGMRKLGKDMFYECRNAKIFIRDLSNNDRITISNTAFKYLSYNPSLENQERGITLERPVILFSKPRKDVLTTTEEKYTSIISGEETLVYENPLVEGETDKYYKLNEFGEKIINYSNLYYSFINSMWLREVYFDIEKVVFDDETLVENSTISYAQNKDGQRILFDLQSQVITEFNNKNKLKLISEHVGAIPISSTNLPSLRAATIVVPQYDCLDTTIPKFEMERVAYPIFVNSTTNKVFNISEIKELGGNELKEIYVYDSKIIPDKFFENSLNIDRIYIGEEIEKIGLYAFYKSGVSDISIIDGNDADYTATSHLREIGEYAFAECANLTGMTLPDSVEIIGNSVFNRCTKLTTVNMPNNAKITALPEGMFSDCQYLQYVNFKDYSNITQIGASCFYNCQYLMVIDNDSVIIDKFTNLQTIGDYAFYATNKITSLNAPAKFVISKKIKYIGASAFQQTAQHNAPFSMELVWDGDYENDFRDLVIMDSAFRNIYTSWTSENGEKINGALFVPRVSYLGRSVFTTRTRDIKFSLCLMKNTKDEIGDKWVENYKKIIYEYSGVAMIDGYVNEVLDNRTRYILSKETRENPFEIDMNYDGTAYLHEIISAVSDRPNVTRNQVSIPAYIEVEGKKYGVIQVLSGAFNRLSNNTSETDMNAELFRSLSFEYNSRLELIESEVIRSSEFNNIILEVSPSKFEINIIPSTLTIETGNNLKNTLWFESISNSVEKGSFIKLGRYIIGYVPTEEQESMDQYSLDLTVDSVRDCDIIFDNAFENNIFDKVIFPELDDYRIYQRAFAGNSYLTAIDLPKNISYLGAEAFAGCPFTKIFIPNTVTYIGDNALTYASDGIRGTLTEVDIEDGIQLEGAAFGVPTEITTGISNPTTVNITLRSLHIPTTADYLVSSRFSTFNILSQITNLTVGPIERAEDGSMFVGNYPLYKKEIGDDNFTAVYEDTGVPYLDENGKQVYVPKFYHDVMSKHGQVEDTSLTTLEPKSICPIGYQQGQNGFDADINLSNVRVYRDSAPIEGVNVDDVVPRPLSREDILRILAGYNGLNSHTIELPSDASKLSGSDLIWFVAMANVTLKYKKN